MLQNRLAQLREKRAEGEKGFTLIELLVVVVIIGVLIAIAIPLYLNYKTGAENKSAQSDVRNAVATLEQCYTDNSNAYPDTSGALGAAATTVPIVCGGTTVNIKVSPGNALLY